MAYPATQGRVSFFIVKKSQECCPGTRAVQPLT